MAGSEPLTVVEEHVAAYAARDWVRYKETLAADVIYDEKATGRRVQGADATTEAVKGWIETYADLLPIITRAFACGDAVAAEITWVGTQTGPLVGPTGTIPPTGTHGSVDAVELFRLEGGRIKEIHHYFDFMTILRQAGLMPALAAAR